MSATKTTVKNTVDIVLGIDGTQRIEPPDDDAADWLDRQGHRVMVRRSAPGVYVISPRRAR